MVISGGVFLRGQNWTTKRGIWPKVPLSTTGLECRAQIKTRRLEISSPNGGTGFGNESIFGDRSFLTWIHNLSNL